MKELENGTFAVGEGVTSVVKDITGRDPEDFEKIARRVLFESDSPRTPRRTTAAAVRKSETDSVY